MATPRPSKWARTHAPPAEWRNRLLTACAARLKSSRNATQDERRRTRTKILAEEAARLHDGPIDPATSAQLLDELDALADAADAVAAGAAADDDAHMAELVAFHDDPHGPHGLQGGFASGPADNCLVCPVCTQRDAIFEQGLLSCACGLALNVSGVDGLTAQHVRERLAAAIEQHGASCQYRLHFAVRQNVGMFLSAACACGFEAVVL